MGQRICSIPDCDKPTIARGWCSSHYDKWRRHGDPMHVAQRDKPPAARFWEKVVEQGECWVWTGGKDWDGYGIFSVGKSSPRAHRYAYELMVAPIPDGLQLDHLCRVRNCVNPDHLEPVTSRVNTLRGETLPAVNARKVRCSRGHPLPESRKCPECAAMHTRASRGWSEDEIRQAPYRPRKSPQCPQGHPYDDENTYVDKRGGRHCRTCHRERERSRYRTKKGI